MGARTALALCENLILPNRTSLACYEILYRASFTDLDKNICTHRLPPSVGSPAN
jgi:hypothetical protein